MSSCGSPATRSGATLVAIAALLLSTEAAAATTSAMSTQPQVVVLLRGSSIIDRKLPAFMSARPGQFLSSRALQRTCRSPGLKPDSLVLFLPASQHCELVSVQDQVSLRQRLHRLTGRWPMQDPRIALQTKPFLAIAPELKTSALPALNCSCTGNTPPVGSVICTAQSRTAGAAIGSIVFMANDADGDSLSGTYSYQHDADPVQSGLPSTLSSSCVPGTGTLQCTVDGTAPTTTGIFSLMLSVGDGIDTLPLDSLLEVLAQVPGRIFADGFESLGCQ
ncbi:MAG: hypothetical protein WCD66_12185 [Rhodanobacteraceae bacterium]